MSYHQAIFPILHPLGYPSWIVLQTWNYSHGSINPCHATCRWPTRLHTFHLWSTWTCHSRERGRGTNYPHMLNHPESASCLTHDGILRTIDPHRWHLKCDIGASFWLTMSQVRPHFSQKGGRNPPLCAYWWSHRGPESRSAYSSSGFHSCASGSVSAAICPSSELG